MRIGEVAARAEIHAATLRYYAFALPAEPSVFRTAAEWTARATDVEEQAVTREHGTRATPLGCSVWGRG